jgi:hypothetical protein
VSGEDYITRSFMICIPHEITSVDQIKRNNMGRACGTYEGQDRCIQSFCGET